MLTDKDIFNDGEIVETFQIPKEVISTTCNKKAWGEQALSDFVAQFFGSKARWDISQSYSHNGSLTGTKVVVSKGDIQVYYMLVEPAYRFNQEVHVTKMEVNSKEGDAFDFIDWKYGDTNRSEESLSTPFVALATLKKGLPDRKEVIKLRAQSDRREEGMYQFIPQYIDTDEQADGESSMRFFHPTHEVEWSTKKVYTGVIEKVVNTGRRNKNGKGVLMLNVYVRII